MLYLFISLLSIALLFTVIFIVIDRKIRLHRPATFPVKEKLPCKDAKGKKIMTCIGDSITHGNVSVNYVDMLQADLKEYFIYNAGVNSDTTYSILQRLDAIIATQPNVVTLMIGTNDANATLSERALSSYWSNGKIPHKHRPNAEEFRENYTKIVQTLKAQTAAKVIVLSLPLMGEDLDSVANQRATQYSKIVAEVATQENVTFLPINEYFKTYLAANPSEAKQSFDNTMQLVMTAIVKNLFFRQTFDQISKGFGFSLLTDNLHLNSKGAKIIADTIRNEVQ